jgi:hypothetical protein
MSISNVDMLSLEKNLNKKLTTLRVNDGVNLFMEDGRISHPDVEEYEFLQSSKSISKWETEFELEKNRFTIKFNTPGEAVDENLDDRQFETS